VSGPKTIFISCASAQFKGCGMRSPATCGPSAAPSKCRKTSNRGSAAARADRVLHRRLRSDHRAGGRRVWHGGHQHRRAEQRPASMAILFKHQQAAEQQAKSEAANTPTPDAGPQQEASPRPLPSLYHDTLKMTRIAVSSDCMQNSLVLRVCDVSSSCTTRSVPHCQLCKYSPSTSRRSSRACAGDQARHSSVATTSTFIIQSRWRASRSLSPRGIRSMMYVDISEPAHASERIT
jgi:hypothetical protein